MSFSAGSIVGALGLDTSGYRQGMMEATSIAQTFPNVVQSFMANPILGWAALAKEAIHAFGTALGEVASFVKDATVETGHLADSMGELAQKTGVSVDFLTTVGKVAADAGSSIEGMADALKFLNKNASDAAGGDKGAVEAFAKLGVNATDASGRLKSAEQLFYEVSDAINSLAFHGDKVAASMALMGRGGTDMLAFISMGSVEIKRMAELVRELGGGVDEDLAKMGDKWGTLETLTDAAWTGIKRKVSEPILKFAYDHFDEIVGLIVEGSGTVRRVIGTSWDFIRSTWGLLSEIFAPVASEFAIAVRDMFKDGSTLRHTFDDLKASLGPELVEGLKAVAVFLETVGDQARYATEGIAKLVDFGNKLHVFDNGPLGKLLASAYRGSSGSSMGSSGSTYNASDYTSAPDRTTPYGPPAPMVNQQISMNFDPSSAGRLIGDMTERGLRSLESKLRNDMANAAQIGNVRDGVT